MTKQARLFTTGGSQAVRLPAEFRFEGVEAVFVRRDAAGDVVLSVRPPSPYAAFVSAREALAPLEPGFLSVEERAPHSETRDPFDEDPSRGR